MVASEGHRTQGVPLGGGADTVLTMVPAGTRWDGGHGEIHFQKHLWITHCLSNTAATLWGAENYKTPSLPGSS